MLTVASQVDALERRAIDVLQEVISLRNSLRPVNRLPPEVLASCATFVSDADPRQIIPLTHVCRYWRRSISSDPRCWASISTGWRRLVPLCLERAGAVPLAVDITVSDIRSGEDFLEPLLPHALKIGSFRLAGYSSIEAVTNDLPGFFDSPMPNLTSLELQQNTEPTELFPPSEAPVPPVFQNVAKLESLCLTRTPLYPTIFSIASLVELKLLEYTVPFRFEAFIGFLGSNLDLERVILDVQFLIGSVQTVPARKVALVRLQHLSITCSKAIDSKGLLSCLSLPRGVHLEVVFSQPTQPPDLRSFLPSPPTPIQELLAPITTIRSQHDPREVHLSGNNSAFSFRCSKPHSGCYNELLCFPTSAVREFHTDIRPNTLFTSFLSWLLRKLPALEVLAISGDPIHSGALSALAQEPALCPALKTIAFFDCDMTRSQVDELETVVVKRKETTAARLYTVVIVTKSTNASLDLELIHQLRRSIPHVEVRVDDKLPDLS